jgi:type III secretion protein Q
MEYGTADDGLHTMDGDAGDGQGGTGDAAALFAELDAALPHDAPPAGGEDAPAGLDAVPVTLGFELGKLALPLGDIRTLGAGTVLLLDGGSPASVAITSAGQALGRGEIVDVAGQLGIRITHWGSPC